MKKVFILLHKEVSTIYGATESRKEADKLKAKFTNPDVIMIRMVEICNEMQFIN